MLLFAMLVVALHSALEDRIVAVNAAKVSLIRFNDHASATHRLDPSHAHGLADTMRHEPSGFQGDAQCPVKLVTRNTLLCWITIGTWLAAKSASGRGYPRI